MATTIDAERSPFDVCVCGHRREDHFGEGIGCTAYPCWGLEGGCRRFRIATCLARNGDLICRREVGHPGAHEARVTWP